MPLAKDVMRGGQSAGGALAMLGAAATTVSAAGTTQGTATSLTASNNFVSTAAASSGVILAAMMPNESQTVYNGGANTLTVYPPTGSKINNTATNGGVSLATNTFCEYRCFTSTQIVANLSA